MLSGSASLFYVFYLSVEIIFTNSTFVLDTRREKGFLFCCFHDVVGVLESSDRVAVFFVGVFGHLRSFITLCRFLFIYLPLKQYVKKPYYQTNATQLCIFGSVIDNLQIFTTNLGHHCFYFAYPAVG